MRALFALFILSFLPVFSQAPVKGTMSIDGKVDQLTGACAYEETDPFDRKKTRLVALVWTGGTPLAGECREFSFELQDLLRSKGLPYLSANIQVPSMIWETGILGAGRAPVSFSYSGDNPTVKFEPASAMPKGTLVGRLLTLRQFEMTGFPKMNLDAQVDIKFLGIEPVSGEITGTDAVKHPAGLAAVRFLTAMSKSDMKGVRAMIVEGERAKFDADMASADGKQMLAMMTVMAKETVGTPVSSVMTRGPLTVVRIEKKTANGKQASSFTFRQENGEYRVTQKR